MIEWIIALVVLGIVAIGVSLVLAQKKRRKETMEPDYHTLFILGLSFMPVGLVFMIIFASQEENGFIVGLPLFALGLIYLALGLMHKKEWQQSQAPTKRRKK